MNPGIMSDTSSFEDTLMKILNWVGNGFSLIYFSTPLIQIIQLYKGTLKKEAIPLYLLLTIVFNCLFWILNAFSDEAGINGWIPLLASNVSGIVINLILLFLYLYLLLDKNTKQFIGYGFFVINLVVEISYLMFRFIITGDKKKGEEEKYATFHTIGLVATIINMLMYLSPALNLKKLAYTEEREKKNMLPIFTLIVGFFSTLSFLVYGVISYSVNGKAGNMRAKRNALETIVSNGVSFLVVSAQIGIWAYLYLRNAKKSAEDSQDFNINGAFTNDRNQGSERGAGKRPLLNDDDNGVDSEKAINKLSSEDGE